LVALSMIQKSDNPMFISPAYAAGNRTTLKADI
jgi:hypothetical protein